MPNKSEGGWSGIGMANSGIHPTHVLFLNDHPTQIPPSEILGPVVQNCRPVASFHVGSPCIDVTISKKIFVFIRDGLERVREALPEGGPPLQNFSKIIHFLGGRASLI